MDDSLRALLANLVSDLERRFPYAAALYTSASGTRASIDNREQSASLQDPSQGVVFTLLSGESFEEYATSNLEPEHLARDVRAWAESIPIVRNQPAQAGFVVAKPPPGTGARAEGENAGAGHPQAPVAAGVSLDASSLERFKTPCQIAPASLSLPEKLERLRGLQSRARGFHPQIVNARLSYSDTEETKLFIGDGRQMLQEITRISLFASIIVSDGQSMQHNWLAHAGTGGLEVIEVSEPELAGVCETTLRLLDAEKIEPGLYEVVTDPTVSGVIAHECFGHGVELDLFPKGRSRSASYFDQRVAAPGVEMYDDPTVPGAYGSYFFDDEGQPAAPTQILRDGVLVSPISDLMSALLTKRRRTANGRRESYASKSYARMSNTFFGAGKTPSADLLAGLEQGIYLRQASSGMEDPMGWGVQVTAHYGEEIRSGQPTGRLFAPIGITGYVPDLLQSISGIGSDVALDGGWCGKGHKEWVPVSSGGPHLRMKARLG
ncbi:MAG TPA: TldD/PmbA family protein [Ktedonobacterales bacterium]|nr:TldD/PmbA family protein [Ktedonobacterales bacterium]